MSKSLSLKVDVLPQQCHKSKAFSFQFQEQDASSTKSTDQSYPKVGTTQFGIWVETCLFVYSECLCISTSVWSLISTITVYISYHKTVLVVSMVI